MPPGLRVLRGSVLRWSIAAAVVMASMAGVSAQSGPKPADTPPGVPRWPCRLIAAATLRRVIEQGWERSPTIRRQCEELASARAVVVLEWGAMDSQSHATTAMGVRDGVVVATVKLPPLGDTIVLLAHELQHVLERTRGLDLEAEAKRRDSGVWRAFGGYETQAAMDVSRRVAQELEASVSARRRARPRREP